MAEPLGPTDAVEGESNTVGFAKVQETTTMLAEPFPVDVELDELVAVTENVKVPAVVPALSVIVAVPVAPEAIATVVADSVPVKLLLGCVAASL